MAVPDRVAGGAAISWIWSLLDCALRDLAVASQAEAGEATLIGRGLIWLLAVAAWLWPAQIALAAGSGEITVSPVFQNVHIGQGGSRYVITIANDSSVSQAFRFSAADFGSLNDTGGVAFVGDTPTDFSKAHGLAKWMTLEKDSAVIAAGEKMQLGVTVNNDDSLSAGGHYGAVIAEALTAPENPSGNVRVGVKQVITSLILLVKDGAAPPDLQLVSQVPSRSGPWKLPTDMTMRFSNEGAVHVVPRGVTSVKDPLGREVERGALNENSGIVLPGALRKYDTPLMRLASAWMPGRYSVATTYRYDGSEATKVLATSFWYLGSLPLMAGLLLVLVLMGGGVWWLIGLWRNRR